MIIPPAPSLTLTGVSWSPVAVQTGRLIVGLWGHAACAAGACATASAARTTTAVDRTNQARCGITVRPPWGEGRPSFVRRVQPGERSGVRRVYRPCAPA